MLSTTDDIQRLYEEEYGDLEAYAYLLNSFREHADRLVSVMKMVKEANAKTLLDVGCNRGLFGALCNWSHQPLEEMVGIDIVPRALEAAWKTHHYTKILHMRADQPFDLRRRFDVTLCMEILEHVPDPDQVVINCLKHTQKTAIFSTPLEEGDIDGKIHVRMYTSADLILQVTKHTDVNWAVSHLFLPSWFCEKPHWQGWNYVIARRVE